MQLLGKKKKKKGGFFQMWLMQEQAMQQSSFTSQVCDRDAKNMEITSWVKNKTSRQDFAVIVYIYAALGIPILFNRPLR